MTRFLAVCAFAVAFMTASPARADMCYSGACGHWSSLKIDVLVRGDSMIWTDGTRGECTIFAQDDYITVVACNETATGKRGKREMYYFLQALDDDMHIRASRDLPSCLSRRACWPKPGGNFVRLANRP